MHTYYKTLAEERNRRAGERIAEQEERRNRILEEQKKEADMKANLEKTKTSYNDAEMVVRTELGDLYSNNEKHRCFSKEVALLLQKEVPYCTHIVKGKDIVCTRCWNILTRLQPPATHEHGCLTAKCGSLKSHYSLKRLPKCECFKPYEPLRYTPKMKSYWTLLMILKFSLKIWIPKDIRKMLFEYIDRTEYIINDSRLHTVPYGDFPNAKAFLKKYHSACPNQKYDEEKIAWFISHTLDMKEIWKKRYPQRINNRQRKAINRAKLEENRKPKRSHEEREERRANWMKNVELMGTAYLESKK